MASIQLLHDYAGRRTNEDRVWAGVYDAADPRLYGLAEYLVENGHAIWTDAPAATHFVAGAETGVDSLADAVLGSVEWQLDEAEAQAKEPVEPSEELEFKGRKLKVRRSKE